MENTFRFFFIALKKAKKLGIGNKKGNVCREDIKAPSSFLISYSLILVTGMRYQQFTS